MRRFGVEEVRSRLEYIEQHVVKEKVLNICSCKKALDPSADEESSADQQKSSGEISPAELKSDAGVVTHSARKITCPDSFRILQDYGGDTICAAIFLDQKTRGATLNILSS